MTRRTLLGLVGLALLVAGCADASPVSDAGPDRAASAAPAASSSGPTQGGPTNGGPTGGAPTELPPGDPGLDASSVPDPGKPEDDGHGKPGRTSVPAESMLGSATVAGVLGGHWQEKPGGPVDCVAPANSIAERTTGYGSGGSQVSQTVAIFGSPATADREVARAARRLRDCGWTTKPDPRLGSASAAAANGESESAFVVATEGVIVTLVGSGPATANRLRWSSLMDVSLGNACAAAPDGCH